VLSKNSILARLPWLAILLEVHALYFPINRTMQGGWLLITPWDRYVPFWPIWAIPYLASMGWWVVCYIWAYQKMDTRRFQCLVISMIFTLLTSYLVFIFFPTYVERPIVHGNSWQYELIQGVFNNDRVNNAFPSGHTYTTMIILFYWWEWRPRLRWLWVLIAAIILLSTLFTGQHHLLDPIGGIIWAWVGYRVGAWWMNQNWKGSP